MIREDDNKLADTQCRFDLVAKQTGYIFGVFLAFGRRTCHCAVTIIGCKWSLKTKRDGENTKHLSEHLGKYIHGF